MSARSHLLQRAGAVVVRYVVLGLTAISVGCASPSSREQQLVENTGPDQHHRASDSQLNAASDRYTGGDLDRYEHSEDVWTKSHDRVLNAHSATQPKQQDVILSGPDQSLQAADLAPLVDGPETPKRAPDTKEMLAITVAASESVGDPNAIQILRAGVDDTQAPVRVVCARLHDNRLDDTNNRFNVFFGVLSLESKELRVSIIDSGARAAVACQQLGYI